MADLPPELIAEREALIAEIHAAFKGVKRGRGTSWAEAGVLSDFGTEKELRAARATDTDQHWPALVNSAMWRHNNIEWSYLDAEGFRYYLPAGMIHEAFIDPDSPATDLLGSLTFSKPSKRPDHDLREHTLKKWSLLNDRQRRCVKRFLQFKAACAAIEHERYIREHPPNRPYTYQSGWAKAIDSYWASIPDA